MRRALGIVIATLMSVPVGAEPLVAYTVDNYAIPTPLTTEPGDVERGRALATQLEVANCLACHAIPVEAEFPGTTGPDLAGVGDRLSPAQLRLRLVDPKQLNPMTMMPAYYRTQGLHRVAAEFIDQPILSAQQIEDLVAFLASLKRAP